MDYQKQTQNVFYVSKSLSHVHIGRLSRGRCYCLCSTVADTQATGHRHLVTKRQEDVTSERRPTWARQHHTLSSSGGHCSPKCLAGGKSPYWLADLLPRHLRGSGCSSHLDHRTRPPNRRLFPRHRGVTPLPGICQRTLLRVAGPFGSPPVAPHCLHSEPRQYTHVVRPWPVSPLAVPRAAALQSHTVGLSASPPRAP